MFCGRHLATFTIAWAAPLPSHPATPVPVPTNTAVFHRRTFLDDVERIMAAAAESEAGTDGRVSFDDFIHLLEQAGPAGPLEGPDPKVQKIKQFILTPTMVDCELWWRWQRLTVGSLQMPFCCSQFWQGLQKLLHPTRQNYWVCSSSSEVRAAVKFSSRSCEAKRYRKSY